MAQLQNAMSESLNMKAKEPEQVKPGLPELPKLAELSANSAIDVGDWLHGLQNQMGDLSNSSGTWWQEVMTCLARYYESYLAASHVGKLSLKPESFESELLRDPRWTRVDKRAASMVLASIPEAIKGEILATRLVGTLPILARIVVLYRPGSVVEKQQILKALESPGSATTAGDAVAGLRKWGRWMSRASDVGLQPPDPSVLIKGLDALVKGVLAEHQDTAFPVSMLRYTLEVDTRPTEKGARDLHQALLSEFEQIAYRGKPPPNASAPSVKAIATSPSTATTTPPKTTSSGGADAGGGSPKGKAKAPCRFYLTDKGCSKGASCSFSHNFTRKEKMGRCWTCGSSQHQQTSCPVKAGGTSPTTKAATTSKAPSLAAASAATSSPNPEAQVTPSSSSAPSVAPADTNAQASPMPESELKSLLQEASAMLKEIRQLKAFSITTTQIQNQAVRFGCDPATGRTGLLDSRASHPFREASEEEIQASNHVQLAGGREVVLAQGKSGTLMASKTGDATSGPIVPLGALVQELGCQLSWTRRGGLVIRHPQHGVIRPTMIGRCPVVAESQALDLIYEIECQKLKSLENATRATAKAMWLWDVDKPWAQHLEDFVWNGDRTSQLAAMSVEGSPFASWTVLEKSLLAENVELTDKAGWIYLRALPGSRQRRKRMMSLPWVVHLYSGGEKAVAPELRELDDGRVLVQVDISRSRAEDMNAVAGVYSALLWAAATGRIDGLFGSPPNRPELVQRMMWLSMVAKAARATRGGHPAFVLIEGKKLLQTVREDKAGRWSSVSSTWDAFLEAVCLEEVDDNIVTNLKILEPVPLSTMHGQAWTVDFKHAVVRAVEQWGREPEALQVMKWIKKLDAEGEFLEGFTDKELKMWRTHIFGNWKGTVEYDIPESGVDLLELSGVDDLDDGHGVGDVEFGEDWDPMEEDPERRSYKGPREDECAKKGLSQEEFDRIYKEVDTNLDFDVVYVVRPLRTRTASEETAAVRELVLRLRAEGLHVGRVHSDRARELRVEPLRRWLLERGILSTYTEGQSPQSNGRAEAAVKWLKTSVKRLLEASGLGKENWAVAANYAAQDRLERTLRRSSAMLPFGTKVHVRSKVYGTGGRYDLDSRWKAGRYVGPSLDVRGGHVIRFENGAYMTSTHLRPHLVEPDKVVEMDEFEVMLPMPTRRFRTKVGARDLDPSSETSEPTLKYDPDHPAEQFALRLLEEETLTPVFVKYVKQLQPDHKFNALAVTVNIGAQQHIDAHNVGQNLVAGLSYFKGGGLEIEESGGKRLLPLDGDHTHQLFDPKLKHSTKPWYGGTRVILVAYSIRDSGKLKTDKADYLKSFGFDWVPHYSRAAEEEQEVKLSTLRVNLLDAKESDGSEQHRDSPEQEGTGWGIGVRDVSEQPRDSPEQEGTGGGIGVRDVSEQPRDSPEQEGTGGGSLDSEARDVHLDSRDAEGDDSTDTADAFESLSYLTNDVEVAIGDLEDRAVRLRDLLEEEEIICEEYRRLGQTTREALGDVRQQVSEFLDEVHDNLLGFERLRTLTCLKAAKVSSTSSSTVEIDYEEMLDALADDLKIVHTVPVDQVKRYLTKWVEAIRKEVSALFKSGTLRRISLAEAKQLERSSQVGTMTLILRPTVAEPELWMVVCEITGTMHGLIVLYVDDIAYFSTEEIVKAIHEFITQEWPASPLEWISADAPVRYLGVEIRREPRTSESGRTSWVYTIGQGAYVQELLKEHNMTEVHPTSLPAPKEWVEEAESNDEVENDYDEATLKLAQKYVGECLWLATKTRPDIMFVTTHAASLVSKRPSYVIRLGERVLAYLAGSADLRMTTGPVDEKDTLELVAFTDASYAPYGRRSFGAAVITLAATPVAWKSGRQSFITLSVMEAELYAATQGCTLLNSVEALAAELFPAGLIWVLAVDNTSAAAMLAGGPGSQRTRHLKIRANYVREAVEQGRLIVRHTPGSLQLADLSTKMQSKVRLHQLLQLWGFIGFAVDAIKEFKMKVLSFLLVLAQCVCPTRAQQDELKQAKDPLPGTGWDELLLMCLITSVFAVLVWEGGDEQVLYIEKKSDLRSRSERFTPPTTPRAATASSLPTTPLQGTPEPRSTDEEVERVRVCHDVLQLMTCEELRRALCLHGLPVSGLKEDQIGRIHGYLVKADTTVKQLKYVLYLWRSKSLAGRCKLCWHDIDSKIHASTWISVWKN
ncbi:TY2B-DR3 [Symbiodinium microadriaticum]|nr:TY2B-DR3 [Symbiodinium microadriaticum]